MPSWGWVFALSAGLALGGCGSVLKTATAPISSENPGTNVKIKNPDPAKWAYIPQAPQRPGTWVCKPLACAGQAGVAISTGRSPTRHPDRTALEKAAKLLPTQFKAQDLMMDAASEGDERITSLSSKVTTLRDYPAIVAEAKRTIRGKATFMVRADMFVGMVMVRIVSLSTERQEAMKHLESFVAQMEILDVEPSTPAGAEGAAVTLDATDPPAPPSLPR